MPAAGGGGGSPSYVITIVSYGGPSSDGPTAVNSGGGVISRSVLLKTVSWRRRGRSCCAEDEPDELLAEDCNGDIGGELPPKPASAYHDGRSLVGARLLTRVGLTDCGGDEGGESDEPESEPARDPWPEAPPALGN